MTVGLHPQLPGEALAGHGVALRPDHAGSIRAQPEGHRGLGDLRWRAWTGVIAEQWQHLIGPSTAVAT